MIRICCANCGRKLFEAKWAQPGLKAWCGEGCRLIDTGEVLAKPPVKAVVKRSQP
jgi:hypothetical protein